MTESSSDLDNQENCVPDDILESAKAIQLSALPSKSKALYMKAYNNFMAWKEKKKIGKNVFSEDVMLVYFGEIFGKIFIISKNEFRDDLHNNKQKNFRDLRQKNTPHNRFFVNYQMEQCTVQPIGKHKFESTEKTIASLLQLYKPEEYTIHWTQFSANWNSTRC